jgi:hypothetical protein
MLPAPEVFYANTGGNGNRGGNGDSGSGGVGPLSTSSGYTRIYRLW